MQSEFFEYATYTNSDLQDLVSVRNGEKRIGEQVRKQMVGILELRMRSRHF